MPGRRPSTTADDGLANWDELLADDRVVHTSADHGRLASLVDLPGDLHPAVRDALARAGIDSLYSHQAQALDAAARGPVIVTTGTASGKSLCFHLPMLDTLARDPKARALYVYPTKALAQDQARAINAFGLTRQVRPAIYDGDTPSEARTQIRRQANVILTNPDMLHLGILPRHTFWEELFANLAIVAIDEAHVYRGVFGSHVANVIRRLRRIAAAYGTEPRFLLASATIANPRDLAERLTGFDDVTLVDRDGSPAGRRRIAVWNPPLTDEAAGLRRSTIAEGAELLARLVSGGVRTICFVRSRKAVELVHRMAQVSLDELGAGQLASRITPYRAGYTSEQRRDIERRLSAGELMAVVTTDALELGIDVGGLDAAIVISFPGTVASLRQMWGRAGRRGRGLAVYIAGPDALDQFFARHPQDFLDRPVEAAILDHESEEIHLQHLVCAAHEGPLDPVADAEFFGPRLEAYADRLVGTGDLRRKTAGRSGDVFVVRARERYPAGEVSLRSASADRFSIIEARTGEVLGTDDATRAHSTLHDGAVYLHMGSRYLVRGLDLDLREAVVEPFDGDYYTQPKTDSDQLVERLLDRRQTMGVTLSLGRVIVTETVTAYQRRHSGDHHPIDIKALQLPPRTFQTQAIWFEPGDLLADDFPRELLLGSLHATEHAQIAVLPLIAMCDRWDIGGLSTNAHPQTGGPVIFIHEAHSGGVGIVRQAFREFETLVADAHRLIGECPCEHGCPSCVQSPKCGNLNEPLSKPGARELLRRMLQPADQPRQPRTIRP
ncbi:MAG TPA: DEAD/DEAH box helicase [Solirubrobacteraceae bacterium]|nr:DEAD/DEAH box helicase [Solirubrobacteraceae bacterium]